MNFKQDFDNSVSGCGFSFSSRGNVYDFNGGSLRVVLVPLCEGAGFTPENAADTIYLFEDRWFTSKNLIAIYTAFSIVPFFGALMVIL